MAYPPTPVAQPFATPAMQPKPPQPLGSQVNNWVNHSASQMPVLNPPNVPDGMFHINTAGAPLPDGQHPPIGVPDPNAVPPVPAAPGAAPPVAIPPSSPEHPGNLGLNNRTDRWQDRLNSWATANPDRYAKMLPILQHLMQKQGFRQFGLQLPPAPQTPMPQNPAFAASGFTPPNV